MSELPAMPPTPPPAPTPAQPPLSRAALSSLRFALLIIVVNVALNLIANALLEANSSVGFAVAIDIVHVLVVLALFGAALWFGVVGLRETAGGALRGRGRAIGGIVLASVLVVLSFGVTIAQVVASFVS